MAGPFKNDNSNRPATAAAKNDNSSKKATAAKQEGLDSAASAEAAKKAEAERIENELKELKELRELKTTQAQRIEKEAKELNELRTTSAAQAAELKDLREFKQGVDRKVLTALNNLNPDMHHHRWYLTNAHSRQVIETRGGQGQECRSKAQVLGNQNQGFYLEKVDPKDPQSAWTISSNEGYLEFVGNTQNHEPICTARKTDSSKKNQEWNIGYYPDWPGRYRLYNIGQSCYVSWKYQTETFIAMPWDNSSSQHFLITTVEPFMNAWRMA